MTIFNESKDKCLCFFDTFSLDISILSYEEKRKK